MAPTAPAPLDLPRLVMRGALAVAALVLLLALGLGLQRAQQDIGDEVDAALSLAAVVARLAQPAATDDAAALAALRAAQQGRPLRHLSLQVTDAGGRVLLAPPPDSPDGPLLRGLLALHRAWLSAPDARAVQWSVDRPGGGRWTVRLAASHEAERRESLLNLLGMLGLLLACVAALLLAMRANLRRAFAPLGTLLAAIAGIGHAAPSGRPGPSGGTPGHDTRALQALPTMPVRELEAVAAALRRLGAALDEAEAQRRRLAQQVATLQDDERARLARELHDEFGQHLTALRVDAAWLARRTEGQPELHAVAAGIAAHGQAIQHDVRVLLARLQPFGPPRAGGPEGEPADGGTESLASLLALLRSLTDGWAPRLAAAGTALRFEPRLPEGVAADTLALPRALALAVYRISQESLTNIARHAGAASAVLALELNVPEEAAPDAYVLRWAVRDDGVGLGDAEAAMQRGNGLAGLRERVWALGADLACAPATPGAPRPGVALSARFSVPAGAALRAA